jgi:hypothetical protein
MIKTTLAVVILCVCTTSVFAQDIAPTLTPSFLLAWGCNYIAESNGTDAVGTTSCDYPAATTFSAGGFDWNGDVGSYYLGFCGIRNGDGTYEPFGEPILPISCAGSGLWAPSWYVGGYDYIWKDGVFFDASGGVKTYWYKVIANARDDAFILGHTSAGGILAKFRGSDNARLFVRNGIGGSAITRDKGGNIYIANGNQVTKYNPDATKVVYTATIPNGYISSIYVDVYSQLYITGETGGGLPVLYAPQPLFGGESDAFLTVLSPTGKRIVYSSYLGGWGTDYAAGVSADELGNAYVAGTDLSYEWDGRPGCDPSGGANCSEMFFVAAFGPFRNSSVPNKLKFGTRQVGTTTAKKILFKNLGNVPLNVSSVQVSGSEYAQINTCNVPIKPDKTCAVKVSFTPFTSGEHDGSLVVVSDSLISPQQVALSGKGQ